MEIPEPVRLRAMASGGAGLAWLDSLPDLSDALAADWGLRLGAVLAGGTEAVVLEAWTQDGRAAVLKLNPPENLGASQEMHTLAAANGRGYAQLHRVDAQRGAMLLQRLGAQLAESGLPVPAQLAVMCETLQKAWDVPACEGLVSGAEKAAALADFIEETWRAAARPCPRVVIDTALSHAETRRRAFDPAQTVLAHGDAHAWNALKDPNGPGYKFVDPDGLTIEPAYDLGISMREWTAELLAGDPLSLGRERCRMLSQLTGVPSEPIWQWGFIERVSTGLLCLQLGLPDGREMLAVAEAWAQG